VAERIENIDAWGTPAMFFLPAFYKPFGAAKHGRV
jgi:hypothetical protein